MTLPEIATAVALLTIGLLGLASGFAANAEAHARADDDVVALHALRGVAESIRATPFDEIAKEYGSTKFEISELGAVGLITVFTDETAATAEAQQLGLPRDLDGDGAATNKDTRGVYSLLPIRIEVFWGPGRANESSVLNFLLSQ